jgi:cytoskeleton protein RodZ
MPANAMAKPWEGEGGSFGNWLRQQREIRNITLREISDNTKIGMRYLEALEEDRFEVLPAPIFAKGFLREYAKYVGLDPDEVVNFYLTAEQRHRAERGGDDVSGVLPIPPGGTVKPARPLPIGWLLAALGAFTLLLVVFAVVWVVKRNRADRPPEQPQAEATPGLMPVAPAPASAAPPQAVPGQPPFDPNKINVALSFTAECWIEVLVDGDRRIAELHVAGESMRVEARESVLFEKIGKVSAVRMDVNGKPMQLPAGTGEVVNDLLIDRATAGLPPLPAAPAPGR